MLPAAWLHGILHIEEGDLEDAQNDYQNALTSEFRAARGNKAAGTLEKQGSPWDTIMNIAGVPVAVAAATALGTGAMTYSWAKSRSPSTILARAQKERAKRLWRVAPQPVYAVPKTIPVDQSEET